LRFRLLSDDSEEGRIVKRAVKQLKGGPNAAFYSQLETDLGRDIAVFRVVPSAGRSETVEFDADFDMGIRDFVQLHRSKPKSVAAAAGSILVLGEYIPVARGRGGIWRAKGPVYSLRLGDARGAAVHDCTGFDSGRNLIGPELFTYGFPKCFETPGNLATPRMAFLYRDPLYIPSSGMV
jgi:hypothetical protein